MQTTPGTSWTSAGQAIIGRENTAKRLTGSEAIFLPRSRTRVRNSSGSRVNTGTEMAGFPFGSRIKQPKKVPSKTRPSCVSPPLHLLKLKVWRTSDTSHD